MNDRAVGSRLEVCISSIVGGSVHGVQERGTDHPPAEQRAALAFHSSGLENAPNKD